jgi:hypothetical protein
LINYLNYRYIEYYNQTTSLGRAEPGKWDSLLFALLLFLDRKKKMLHGSPNIPFKWIPSTLDVEHCRTMSRVGTVNNWALEAFSTYVHNGVANITGRTLAGTNVLPVEFYFSCSGQWQYCLSEEGRRALHAEYSSPISPHEVHSHCGKLCRSPYFKFDKATPPENLEAYATVTTNINNFCVSKR